MTASVTSEVVLGGLLHLLQNHGRDFLRGVLASVDVDTRIAVFVDHCVRHALGLLAGLLIGLTHETLDGVHGVLRVRDGLTLSGVADLALTILHKANHGGSCALTLAVGDYYWLVALENGNAAVGSS